VLPFTQTVFKRILVFTVSIIWVFTPADISAVGPNDIGVVNVNSLNFRPVPGKQKPPIKMLNKGEKIVILESINGWLKVVHKGQVGYIQNKEGFVKFIENEKNEQTAYKNDDSSLQTLVKAADTVNEHLEKSESKVITLTKKEKTIINGLNEIDLVLNTVRKEVIDLQSELSMVNDKINKIKIRSGQLKKEIDTHKGYVDRRLVALYKLNRLGGMPHILSSAESMYEFVKRKTIFERILASDGSILIAYGQDIACQKELLKKQKQQKAEKLKLDTVLHNQTRIFSREKAKRSKLLVYIQSQKRLELAVMESLKQAANALDLKIESYSKESDLTARDGNTPSSPFVNLKGLLKMPAKGRIISYFGPYRNPKYNVINFRNGIDIQTDRGEPIHALFSGKVLYSEWFKGYGNMIIIDHGNHYYTVYSNIEEVFITTGAYVETGEVIATVGDSGSLIGPKLYFEIRHHGEPLDPLLWIKKG